MSYNDVFSSIFLYQKLFSPCSTSPLPLQRCSSYRVLLKSMFGLPQNRARCHYTSAYLCLLANDSFRYTSTSNIAIVGSNGRINALFRHVDVGFTLCHCYVLFSKYSSSILLSPHHIVVSNTSVAYTVLVHVRIPPIQSETASTSRQ